MAVVVLDDLIGVHDDGDEEREDYIDKEADEAVKIDSAIHPHRECFLHGDGTESGKHVVTIDEGKETFGGGHDSLELEVVGTKDNPTSKGEANIEEKSTNQKSEHVRSCSFHCQYQDIVGLEKAKVA